MKMGELKEHCGKCLLIDYCTEPYDTPELCIYEELENVEQEEYKRIADNVTEDEIKDELMQYKENNVSPWDDERNGAIYDIVLEKLKTCAGDIAYDVPVSCKG